MAGTVSTCRFLERRESFMSMRLLSASLTTAALAFAAASLAAAKPPDLPSDSRDTCEAERDLQGQSVSNDPVPELNTRRQSDSGAQPPAADPVKHEHARRMYLIGERCRKKGDLDMAQNCYEETRRLCPVSPYADKAVGRLQQVKAAREASAKAEIDNYEIQLDIPGPLGGGVRSKEEYDAWVKQAAAKQILPSPEDVAQAKQRFEEERKLALQKQQAEARILYLIGERSREGGDKAMARHCFEEAGRLGSRCAYGRKALERLREIDADQGGEEASEPMEEPPPPPQQQSRRMKRIKDWLLQTQGEPRRLAVDLPAVDHLIVHDFDRLLADTEEQAAGLTIVPEDGASTGDEEEQDNPLMPCGGLSPPITLFVEPAPRDLIVHVQTAQTGDVQVGASADLSDWLRTTVRSLNGVGSLKIDAARLGDLLAEGEGALRALGCALVEDAGGQRYVVYPARR
jgi:hypothetical protein